MTSDNGEDEDPYRRHAECYDNRLGVIRSKLTPEATDEEFAKVLDEFCKQGPQVLAAINNLNERTEQMERGGGDDTEQTLIHALEELKREEIRRSSVYRICRFLAAIVELLFVYLILIPFAFTIGAVLGLFILAPWSVVCDIGRCLQWSVRACAKGGACISCAIWNGVRWIVGRA